MQAAPPERHWRLGAAVGYGERSNPLIQSEDIPVLIDLDIAWFGKRWFFDNGDVGLMLFDSAQSTTSLVARYNSDRVFFGKTNAKYVNFAYAGNGEIVPMTDPITGAAVDADVQVEVVPPDRDYAIELGVEIVDRWRLGRGDAARLSRRQRHARRIRTVGVLLAGAGSRAGCRLHLPWVSPTRAPGSTTTTGACTRTRPTSRCPSTTRTMDSIRSAACVANYHLTRNLRLALSLNYERLADDVAASPLAEESHVLAYFSGLAWTF